MEAQFKAWKTSRSLIAQYFEKYDLEQLNQIPEGFNNNLIWNLGHIIVAQQGLIYKGSGLDPYISQELSARYQPGTKPEAKVKQQEVDELRGLLTSLIDKTESDFKKGIFKSYKERTTATGFHLASIEDAFEFNNYHEALHLGAMMAIRKFV
ncbi:DinB superfamily protein [Reichenbachiella faecimaris]|uniref:DinB superfamily protein n=1 Tax=Reichenbachiella faecimaris TaxID=692418 RepID=A0A1W2GDQ2_REIFA|nr:DinB family protein [Reichenbachiella faecimaris]SMD34654.1 DinB superfamily protein [Reichenbachiella faecimaris]